MAETYKKLPDGTLQISRTGNTVISTMSQAEIQTIIDHLNGDIAEKEQEKAEWISKLELVKTIEIK